MIDENIVLVEGRLSIREDEAPSIIARTIRNLEDVANNPSSTNISVNNENGANQAVKISKKRFEKLKKSQRKWIKYRDKKAWEAYDKEQGGSIAGVSYIESIIKNTKRRTKWIMDTYL